MLQRTVHFGRCKDNFFYYIGLKNMDSQKHFKCCLLGMLLIISNHPI